MQYCLHIDACNSRRVGAAQNGVVLLLKLLK